jgi:hypothetical protein
MMHYQVILASSVGIFAFVQAGSGQPENDSERIRQIATVISDRFDNVANKGQRVQVFWQSEVHHQDPAISDKWLPRESGSGRVMSRARYELLSRQGASKWSAMEGDATEWEWVFAYDGENSWASTKVDQSIQLFRAVRDSPDPKLKEGLPLHDWFSEAIGMQPRTSIPTWGISGGLPYPYRLDVALATGHYQIVSDNVKLRESTCIVVEREGLDRVWLDTERSYAIVQREWNWEVSKPVRIRLENEEFEEATEGLWIPRRFRLIYFGTPETRPEVECLTVHAVVEDYEFAPPSLSFTPNVSSGELIFDHVTEDYYRAPQEEDLDLANMVTPQGIASEFEKVQEEGRSDQLRFLIFFSFFALIAIIVFGAWRRRLE